MAYCSEVIRRGERVLGSVVESNMLVERPLPALARASSDLDKLDVGVRYCSQLLSTVDRLGK